MMNQEKDATTEMPPVPSVQPPFDNSTCDVPKKLLPDAALEGQSAIMEMQDVWYRICDGSRKKRPSYEIAELLAREFATRLEFFLLSYPIAWQTSIAKEVIRGILYEVMRLDTDIVE